MRVILVVAVAAVLAVPVVAQAQAIPEIRPFAGAYVATGDQRDLFKNALMVGGQVAVEAADMLHVVGTLAFTGPNFKRANVGSGHMHVYQIDVGGELFRNSELNPNWKFRPFVGAGAGVRRYDPTANGDSRNYPAAYGALGAEFQVNRVAIRLETRDYLTRFKGLSGNDEASTRNEVAITAGLAYHL